MSIRRWIGRFDTGPVTTAGPGDGAGPDRWLVAFAIAYGFFHHQGFLFGGLGNLPRVGAGGTRFADWLDLLTPFLVLGPALVAAVPRRRSLPGGPVAKLLALQFGLTWATNGLEGGTAVFSGLVAAGFVVRAMVARQRGDDDGIAATLLWCFGPSLLLVAGYGVLNRGFPQPSEIGWGVFG